MINKLILIAFFTPNSKLNSEIAYALLSYEKNIREVSYESFIVEQKFTHSSLKRFLNLIGLSFQKLKEQLFQEWNQIELYSLPPIIEKEVTIVSDEIILPYILEEIKQLLLHHVLVHLPFIYKDVQSAITTKGQVILITNQDYISFLKSQLIVYDSYYHMHEGKQIFIGLKSNYSYPNQLEIVADKGKAIEAFHLFIFQ